MANSAWVVHVEVFSPDLAFYEVWKRIGDPHPQMDELPSYGWRDEPEGLYASASLAVRAAGPDEARAVAEEAVDAVLLAAPLSMTADVRSTLRVEVEPAARPEGPQGPEDFESRLVAAPWHRSHAVAGGHLLKIVWFTGTAPLERVDVDESAERVTITLWERHGPRFAPDGVVLATPAMGTRRCVEVPLEEPLGARPVYDGATGEQPTDIVPGNYLERGWRSEALELDMDALPCEPMPPRG